MVNAKEKRVLAAAAELRRRAEKLLKTKMPEAGLPQVDEEPLRLLHELQVHQIELELLNAELRQARDEMESTLAKYTDLYDFAPISYFTLDHDGFVRGANLHCDCSPWDRALAAAQYTEDEKAVVSISDNAGGIPEEIIGKIFDPYFTTKGPQLGTGVGLFMSKAIIEKNMNGRLTAQNTAEGAEFRIEV